MSIHHSLIDCRHSVTSSNKLFLLWLLCHVRLWDSSTSEPKETLPSLFCWNILPHQEKNTQWPSVIELSNNVYITNYLYCWKIILNFYLNVCLKEMATHSSDKNTGDWTYSFRYVHQVFYPMNNICSTLQFLMTKQYLNCLAKSWTCNSPPSVTKVTSTTSLHHQALLGTSINTNPC